MVATSGCGAKDQAGSDANGGNTAASTGTDGAAKPGSISTAQFTALKSSFASVQTVLSKNCLPCHGNQNPKAGLDVTSPDKVITAQFITPGDSSKSKLYNAVTGSNGVRKMPPRGPSLTPDEIKVIQSWIDSAPKS